MTYYIEERNATKYWYSSQTTLVSIAVGERVPGYTNNFWYWYWNNPISCFILNGEFSCKVKFACHGKQYTKALGI